MLSDRLGIYFFIKHSAKKNNKACFKHKHVSILYLFVNKLSYFFSLKTIKNVDYAIRNVSKRKRFMWLH